MLEMIEISMTIIVGGEQNGETDNPRMGRKR